jgi:hypothetical protein
MPPSAPSARRPVRTGTVVRSLLVAVGFTVVMSACVPLVSPSTSGRTYGRGPVDAVWDAAAAQPKCAGLTSAELAAMMMVPTYPETGGPIPSPMTLGRWDNVKVWSLNANLFAFAQTSGPYVDAFFTPGVGMWQFDSAGGWPLTAATSIDSVTSAKQAAATISFRYCNAPTSIPRDDVALRKYSWGPWFGCGTTSGWNCEELYQQLYESEMLDTAVDDRVGRFGGMEQRTCDVSGLGTGLTCWYVDPARAQGSTGGWRFGTYSPTNPGGVTPLPKPFYVVEANGREYRYWLPADTGYPIGITGHKPVTANARTSLTWESTAPLCDRTAGRGQCGGTARVASTPWGPRSGDPIGGLDAVIGRPDGSARVTGWALDPDTDAPIDVHFYVDGVGAGATRASVDRPDIAALIPGYGSAHGFDLTIGVGAGTRQVCAYGINVGPYGSTNPLLGCRNVTISGDPVGNLESVTPAVGGIRLTGWALDADTAGPVDIHVYVDGRWGGLTQANRNRPDVGAAYPMVGPDHGFDMVVPSTGGPHQACAYAINVGPNGSTNPLLGCVTVTVSGNPFGNFESAVPTAGGVLVSGWGIDPDTNDATVQLTVDGGAPVTVPTTTARADVGAAYPGRGSAHGFSATVPAAPGSRRVCATLLNQGLGLPVSLGCRTVTVASGNPFGNFELVQRQGDLIRFVGWALDPDTVAPVAIHVYVQGAYAGTIPADRLRSDVWMYYPGYGDRRGFDATVGAAPGGTVCLFAINAGPGTENTLLGCRSA